MRFFNTESYVGDAREAVEHRLLKLFCPDTPRGGYVQKISGYFNFFEILGALGIGTNAEQVKLSDDLKKNLSIPLLWFQCDAPVGRMDFVTNDHFFAMVSLIANSDCHITEQEPGVSFCK